MLEDVKGSSEKLLGVWRSLEVEKNGKKWREGLG